MAENLYPALRRLEKDVKQWRGLPLSVMGRAAIFKMIAMPRLLYILHYSPFRVPGFMIQEGRRPGARSLIWAGGQPDISLGTLQRSKFEGGIALPNLRKYYEAAQLSIVNDWAHAERDDPASRMDRLGMGTHSFLHALYRGSLTKEAKPATQTVVQTWKLLPQEMG